ncbi:MAG: amino acid racemase [Desulfovibrio sp.]|nr:amino acid racemase [Desulfovibrio sp.]
MAGIIGVIGGAGVAATNTLADIIERSYTRQGAFRDAHHPEMIIWQATQAPSRSMFLEGKGPSFIEDYVNVAKMMKAVGADPLCMCCNTAHYALDIIAKQSGARFINLIEEVVLAARQTGKKRLGLVASDGCLASGVYQRHFAALYPEAEIILPDAVMQTQVTKGICNIKRATRFLDAADPESPQHIFGQITEELRREGAEMIVLGCTDIRVAFTCKDGLDSLEVLASCIVAAHGGLEKFNFEKLDCSASISSVKCSGILSD